MPPKYKGSGDYYQQLYTNKLDNLEETDKFLETYNLPKQVNVKPENLKSPITIKNIESVIKNPPTKNRPAAILGQFGPTTEALLF